MKLLRFCPVLLAVLLLSSSAWAHKPLLSVEDNGDGTIYAEAAFSDGSSGAGHKFILKDKSSGAVIKEYKVPGEGSMDIPMPKVPYIVVFDAGPGHTAEQDGPFVAGAAVEIAPAAVEQPADSAAGEKSGSEQVAKSPAVTAAPKAQPVAGCASTVCAPAPVAVYGGSSPGMEMAMKMMITTQIAMSVLLVFIFGAVVFWFGYSVGLSKDGKR